MNPVAVLDLGSARTKLLLARRGSRGNELVFDRFSRETGLGRSAEARSVPLALVRSLISAVNELVCLARAEGCLELIAFGTAVFRGPAGPAYRTALRRSIGEINVLDPQKEGVLFHRALRASGLRGRFMALDIGGGTSQLAWGDDFSDCVSVPTGTFCLVNKYGLDSSPEVREYVHSKMVAVIPAGLTVRTLVMGSNCMLSFVASAMRHLSRVNSAKHIRRLVVTRADLERLLAAIQGESPAGRSAYFPENRAFMVGADKALVNAIVAATLIHARAVLPTNESVSTAIARLALEGEGALTKLGLRSVSLTPARPKESCRPVLLIST